jgi:isopenicillin N synthase-like dioxygenase
MRKDDLKSTLHRVTIPPTVGVANGGNSVEQPLHGRMTKARYSIPYFVAPDPASIIECLPQCAGEHNPPKYAPISQEEYRRMRAKTQYSEKPTS